MSCDHSRGEAVRVTVSLLLAAALGWPEGARAAEPARIGERPAVEQHLDERRLEARQIDFDELFRAGQALFNARFNRLDGAGRPGSTGAGVPRGTTQPLFTRLSGPDANSCFGCHNQPRSGGGGEFTVNVFVLAQERDPIIRTLDERDSNERNTLGMFGAGPIEMLAREMSAELIAIRDAARAEALRTGREVRRPLVAKGVSFGTLLALPDGLIDPRGIDGVDWDLIIKPFHQKGAVVSLREFTVTALNHHHGLQAVERFGAAVDADRDGIADEMTTGDVTALTLYQAALPIPGRLLPRDPERRAAAERGERLFEQVQCASCHLPSLTLDHATFSEPNPYNPPGNLLPADVTRAVTFDMTRSGPGPHVERLPDGRALVRAFTDLKRHDISDGDYSHFANERLAQGTLIGFAPASDFTEPPQPRPVREFLTRKLWDAGNSDPYGHRGDLTTLTEAIYFHGGEARASRDAFFALSDDERAAVIEFLKTLQVLPEGAPRVMDEPAPADALASAAPVARPKRVAAAAKPLSK